MTPVSILATMEASLSVSFRINRKVWFLKAHEQSCSIHEGWLIPYQQSWDQCSYNPRFLMKDNQTSGFDISIDQFWQPWNLVWLYHFGKSSKVDTTRHQGSNLESCRNFSIWPEKYYFSIVLTLQCITSVTN